MQLQLIEVENQPVDQKSRIARASTAAKWSSETNEHYTPPNYANASRDVMGGIELDTASCELANSLVQADRIFTGADNSLHRDWVAKSVFLNPPGGKTNNTSNLAIWFYKLLAEYHADRVRQAVFLSFQMSILRLCPETLDFPICIPKDRIHFWTTTEELLRKENLKSDPDVRSLNRWILRCREDPHLHAQTEDALLVQSRCPGHDNVIIYLPPKSNRSRWCKKFANRFMKFGKVKI